MEKTNAQQTVKEPRFHLVKNQQLKWYEKLAIKAAVLTVAFIFVSLLSTLVLKVSPIKFFSYLIKGTFSTERKRLVLFRSASLLLLIALAITPAFKMKFWNTGAEGQVLISIFACTAMMYYFGEKLADKPTLLYMLMIVASLLAGIIWAVIPAIFKAFFNTNETLFTLMMNYIAIQIILCMIKVWVPGGTGVLTELPYGHLPSLFGNDFYLTIIVAVVVTVLIAVYLKYSKHGYELTVVGESENTAKYIGINVKKTIIRTMILSGAICGVVGLLLCGSINHSVSSEMVGGDGFTAILVSWLASFNPLIMVFMAFLVTFLKNGTAEVMVRCKVTNSFYADVITGIVLLFIIASEFFINYKIKFVKKENKEVE